MKIVNEIYTLANSLTYVALRLSSKLLNSKSSSRILLYFFVRKFKTIVVINVFGNNKMTNHNLLSYKLFIINQYCSLIVSF